MVLASSSRSLSGSPDRVSALSRPGIRPGIRPVIHDRQLEDRHHRRGFPLPFGHRHSLLGHPVPAGDLSPPHGRPTEHANGVPGPRRGYPVPHTRAATGEGALYTPGTTVLTPTEATTGRRLPLHCGQSLHPAVLPIDGACLTRQTRFHANSPVRSSPRLWPPGWNGPPLGSPPGLRTPPTKSRTTHARVGTGHRARTWDYTLNSHQSISNPVVHSLCATSGRTSPKESYTARGNGYESDHRAASADRRAWAEPKGRDPR